MKFRMDVNEYLSDKKFSNGLKVGFENIDGIVYNRLEFLTAKLQKKRVIHVGCVDHIPLIEDKISKGTWLHKLITGCAESCVGIDISREGIRYLREKFGYTNVFHMDIIEDSLIEPLKNSNWDCMILGEILEHVDNPVRFLQKINLKFGSLCEKIVITVPNAFRFSNFINSFRNIEHVNTDHKFWFTPYTVAKVSVQAGFHVVDVAMVEHGTVSKRQVIKNILLRRFPLFRDTIILEANFGK